MDAHQCHGIRKSARRDAEFGVLNDPVEQDHLVGFLERMKDIDGMCFSTEKKRSLRSSEEEHNHFDNGYCQLNDRLEARIHDYGC